MNVAQTVQVFKALIEGPVSRVELARRIDLHPKTIGKLLLEMKAQKLIYVLDYENKSDGRNRVKIYSLGDGEDAQPRRSQSQEARSRRSYLRKVAANNTFTAKTTFAGGKGLWS